MENNERSDGLINVTVDGVLKKARIGDSLSEITKGHKPCGGRGVCGKCKVLADGNISEISERDKSSL